MKIKSTPFIFKKVRGKVRAEINPDFLFEFYTVHGVPPEIMVENMKTWSDDYKKLALDYSWEMLKHKKK